MAATLKGIDDLEKFLEEHPELDNGRAQRILAQLKASEATRVRAQARQEQLEQKGDWGGAREGAGRPIASSTGEKATVNIGYKITPSLAEVLKAQQKEGESLNQTARRMMMMALTLATEEEEAA